MDGSSFASGLVKEWIIFAMCFSTGMSVRKPRCEPVSLSICRGVLNSTQLPNVFGHYTQDEVVRKTVKVFRPSESPCPSLSRFLCVLYLPPCPDPHWPDPSIQLLPCRQVCERAREDCQKNTQDVAKIWPSEVQCHTFPTENCVFTNESGFLEQVATPFHATDVQRREQVQPNSLAPIEDDLGDGDNYEIEIVSTSTSKIPQRRYDVIELGDEDLFHSWADVQGNGAANDYCRVLGRGKRRFLSCALAGSSGQGHQYVSKLGFDAGFPNTWYMRDVDNDGRDDYCRCVGKLDSSKISCMKAGDNGFYGNTVQGGSQYTFDLPGSNGCHGKKLNPHFGA